METPSRKKSQSARTFNQGSNYPAAGWWRDGGGDLRLYGFGWAEGLKGGGSGARAGSGDSEGVRDGVGVMGVVGGGTR